MGRQEDRWPDNVAGRFYINRDCVICSLCGDLAPTVFRASEDGDHNVAWRQPESEDEIARAREAADCCPTEAVCEESPQGAKENSADASPPFGTVTFARRVP